MSHLIQTHLFMIHQTFPTPVLLPGKSHGWRSLVHVVAKSRTRLSDFTFTFHFHALEEEMTTHSSVLAWRIPGTAGPGGLPSMGLHRVRHDWSDLAAAAAKINLRARLELVKRYLQYLKLTRIYCWEKTYKLALTEHPTRKSRPHR